jgi:Cu-Zn family superoxide dismutase
MKQTIRNFLAIALSIAGLILTAGAQVASAAPPDGETEKAIAVLHPTEGSSTRGIVTFTREENGIRIHAEVSGLTGEMHGFHVHEFGDCSAPDATSAGDHFNPTDMPHAGPDAEKRHAGDFGNIEADKSGKGVYDRIDTHISFSGPESIIGRAVVVHEKRDDLTSQPSGDAGSRIACGVVGIAEK